MANARQFLAARTAAWAKSGGGAPTAKDYVQDGLVAMWDGIENVGLGLPHDSTSTVWIDLSDNGYDANLNANGCNGYFGENCLITRGSCAALCNKAIQNQQIDDGYGEFVVEIPFEITNGSYGIVFGNSISQKAVSGRYPTNGLVYDIRSQYSRQRFYYGMTTGAYSNYGSYSFPTGKHTICGSSSINVIDGDRKTIIGTDAMITSSVNPKEDSLFDNACFGGLLFKDGRSYYPCISGIKIMSARIYSRTLNDSERAANRSIDILRFGIL